MSPGAHQCFSHGLCMALLPLYLPQNNQSNRSLNDLLINPSLPWKNQVSYRQPLCIHLVKQTSPKLIKRRGPLQGKRRQVLLLCRQHLNKRYAVQFTIYFAKIDKAVKVRVQITELFPVEKCSNSPSPFMTSAITNVFPLSDVAKSSNSCYPERTLQV